MAILTKALKHYFWIRSDVGRRKALVFRASVADMQSPSIMASTPALCILVICLMAFIKPTVFGLECLLYVGVHHMSTM